MNSMIDKLLESKNINAFAEAFDDSQLTIKKSGSLNKLIATIITRANTVSDSDSDDDLYARRFYLDCLKHIAGHSGTIHEHINWREHQLKVIIDDYFDWSGMDELRLEILKTLKDYFPTFDINATVEPHGLTILMGAVGGFDTGYTLVKGILDLGADIDVTSKEHGKAVHFLLPSEDIEHVRVLEVLLQRGADPYDAYVFKAYRNRNSAEQNETYVNFIEYAKSIKMHDAVDLVMKHQAAKNAQEDVADMIVSGRERTHLNKGL